MIYRWLILTAIHHTNSLVNAFDPLCASLVPFLIKATNKDKALAYNYPQKPHPSYLQKESLRAKSFFKTALLQDLIKCIKYCKL